MSRIELACAFLALGASGALILMLVQWFRAERWKRRCESAEWQRDCFRHKLGQFYEDRARDRRDNVVPIRAKQQEPKPL